jgi:hypothetical protein
MNPQPLPAIASGDPSAWDQALYGFLIENGNRSGSRRTVESYSRMLWPYFADLGKTPDRVKPADVLTWVHGIGRSGRTPSLGIPGAIHGPSLGGGKASTQERHRVLRH